MADAAQRDALYAHLRTGATTVCRAWVVERKDGLVLGFTDHDRELRFDGYTFRPQAGLEATTLVQTSGLSVDNSEGMGILSDATISEPDILAGRFDDAEVRAWLVNWADVEMRMLNFRGTIGEVRWADGAFRAELRGQSEILNQTQGAVYQRPCSALLGDGRCGVDLSAPGLHAEVAVEGIVQSRVLQFSSLGGFADGWFTRGRLRVLDGAAEGLEAVVKSDRTGTLREVELWQELRAGIAVGDRVRIEAGCDRRAGTCKAKFSNFKNFRGFPHVPGEDWLTSYPKSGGDNTGGSLFTEDGWEGLV